MRQQVAPQVGLSYSINDIGVIGRAMRVLAPLASQRKALHHAFSGRIQATVVPDRTEPKRIFQTDRGTRTGNSVSFAAQAASQACMQSCWCWPVKRAIRRKSIKTKKRRRIE
jgi:hypothetical protein